MNPISESLLSRTRIAGALVKLLFAALYSFGISRLVLDLLGLPISHISQGLAITLLLLVMAALTWQRYNLLAFSGIWLILLLLAVFLRDDIKESAVETATRFRTWLDWASIYLTTRSDTGQGTLAILAMIICLAIAAASYLGIARFNWPGLALAALLGVSVSHELFAAGSRGWAVLAGLAVIAAYAREQKRSYQHLDWIRYPAQSHFMLEAMPVAAAAVIIALIASSIWPASAWQSPSLALRLDVLRSELGLAEFGVLPSQGNIYKFSIATAGYYPLGDRLGGPVVLSDAPVMTVTGTPEGLLLRGVVSSTYTGQNWLPGDDVTLYNYDDEMNQNLRYDTFGLQILDEIGRLNLEEDYFEATYYTIRPANQALTTIFLAGKPGAITLGDASPGIYFNQEGLLFIQPAINASQTLRIETSIMAWSFLDEIYANYSRSDDVGHEDPAIIFEAERQLIEDNLQVPVLAEYADDGALRKLVSSIVDTELPPWGQAMQIKEYLISQCRYNLKVMPPPASRDFVSYFLESGQGYCVYFASAETMLCRLAGIPARYVEGYVVPAGENTETERLVTGREAHAWTEIYLSGLGWVPIDATAGALPAEIDATPTPTFSPGKPSPGGNPDDPTPTSPAATGKPSPAVTPGAGGAVKFIKNLLDRLADLSPWWLLLLLILPVIYLAGSTARYRRRYHAGWLEKHYPQKQKLVRYCWQDMTDMFSLLGSRIKVWETPRSFITRIEDQTTWLAGRHETVSQMVSGIEKALYSSDDPVVEEIDAIIRLRVILEKTVHQNSSRLLFLLRRICYHKQKQDMDK